MRKMAVILVTLFILLFVIPLPSETSKKVEAKDILKKIDELYRSTSSAGLMEIEIVTPHWKRTLKCKVWSQGMDKTFIRILEPKKERGMATLRIENEMWNFLPKTNKVIKIPPSMMMGSWMGSDFTNDDLVKEITFIEDYEFEIIDMEKPEKSMIYLKCVPKNDVPVVWGYVILAVRENDYLPVWERYYDEKGKLMREMFFKDIKKFGNKEIPSVMELIPTKKKNHKTIIRYLEFTFDIKIDKTIFTLRNLRSGI